MTMKSLLSVSTARLKLATQKTIRGFMLMLCCMTMVTVGCARPAEVATQDPTDSQPVNQPAAGVDQTGEQGLTGAAAYPTQLVGVWLGEAYLDEAMFEQKFQTIPTERQHGVLNSARTFLTTDMAIVFRADGSMENDMELTPIGGQTIREGSTGNWRAVESKENRILIETTTQLSDGTTATNKQLFHVYPEGDRVALEVSMPGELSECSPLIILIRQPSPDTNVAELRNGVIAK